ncbi:2'-5' RNA ligase [Clostridium cavendishii DSM 21758]|uniref:2'-5' RNA ligase n=1 Tax=Clostridium cavendishii DSM 21758 TaxID=1121302 RepID=A0A1M6FCG1_9CLOT|nr:2'-5' RNA ligase family protein [Clostridium cavendishii]SHI95355.1 2'-5' RNA ligase [Clostridium cavendishii DSM 21758]
MLYVIVSVVKGKVGDFNNRLREEVFKNFKVKSSKLPAHFTIKAPFEYDGDIIELETILDSFSKNEQSKPFKIEGFDHFDNRVIYMKINMSKEGKSMHDRLIENMNKIPYISFDKRDGKDKIFHITVASKRLQTSYESIWEYVNKYSCRFKAVFDNVCIYRWEDNTWKLHREFIFNR